MLDSLTRQDTDIIEGDYMKEIKDMEFEELLKWAQSADWEKVTTKEWDDYEDACKRLAHKYFWNMDITQLEEFYRTYAGDSIDPWFDAWSKSFETCYPFSQIFETLSALETSVKVLLKENENKQANITVGQLNRLKGGL